MEIVPFQLRLRCSTLCIHAVECRCSGNCTKASMVKGMGRFHGPECRAQYCDVVRFAKKFTPAESHNDEEVINCLAKY